MQKDLESEMEKLIAIYLNLNFEEFFKVSSRFVREDEEEEKINVGSVQSLQAKDLEKICNEFLKSYKSKTESIIKDIRSNISAPAPVPSSGQATPQINDTIESSPSPKRVSQKDSQGSSTKKVLTQRLTRKLMLHFTTFVEIVKVG